MICLCVMLVKLSFVAVAVIFVTAVVNVAAAALMTDRLPTRVGFMKEKKVVLDFDL